MMAAIAEGLTILHNANIGAAIAATRDAETAPWQIRSTTVTTSSWRGSLKCGAVAASSARGWLTCAQPRCGSHLDLSDFAGRVSDSGEGRWTAIAAIEEGVAAPGLTATRDSRFDSRSLDEFADQSLSAMRKQFGGHSENAAT